LATASDE
jgi:regulator of replication initiation timing